MSYPASQMTLEALRSVPLFASLDDDAARELRSLLRAARLHRRRLTSTSSPIPTMCRFTSKST